MSNSALEMRYESAKSTMHDLRIDGCPVQMENGQSVHVAKKTSSNADPAPTSSRPPKSQSRERIAIASCFSARPKRWRPSPVTDAESEAVETQEPFEVSAVGTRDNVFNALLSETTTVWKESRVATDTHFTDVST
ncbi:hypothetical protein D6C92_04437 [Aureobasidium pullulans]|nr:hypothetical protein D6C92_04437 [Aureobasidium pullulans]